MEARITPADFAGGKLFGLRWQSIVATPLSSGRCALDVPAVMRVQKRRGAALPAAVQNAGTRLDGCRIVRSVLGRTRRRQFGRVDGNARGNAKLFHLFDDGILTCKICGRKLLIHNDVIVRLCENIFCAMSQLCGRIQLSSQRGNGFEGYHFVLSFENRDEIFIRKFYGDRNCFQCPLSLMNETISFSDPKFSRSCSNCPGVVREFAAVR